MGSTAVALRSLGYTISGSDEKVYPPMSDVLRQAGITVSEGYKADNLPDDADVYVVGNAISRGNEELEVLLERKLPYTSMAELIKREVIQGKRSFVVSGTHGKTTTTTMLAWIFESAGRDPGFMIGACRKIFRPGHGSIARPTLSLRGMNTTRPTLTSAQSFSITCRSARS
jgi:UDP-N-acetylmuramate: L-alanyl-gamma-D-glutamyl-meso-diaminopimelate ligase